MIMGEEAEARKWQVYMIRNGSNRRFDRFTYPLMTNQRKDEFLERFSRRQGRRVRTGAELARWIQGYGMEEYVAYEGYEILDRAGSVEITEDLLHERFLFWMRYERGEYGEKAGSSVSEEEHADISAAGYHEFSCFGGAAYVRRIQMRGAACVKNSTETERL